MWFSPRAATKAWRPAAILATGLAGSQLGHVLVYLIEYGPSSWTIQSTGAHAYFPDFLGAASLAAAILLVAALAVVAMVRLLRAGASGRTIAVRRIPYVELAASLFLLQLVVFCTQETLEAVHAGEPAPQLLGLLFEGVVGQLPLAAVLAAVLGWVLAEFESAVLQLASVLVGREVPMLPAAILCWSLPPAPSHVAGQVDVRRHGSRAPPLRGSELR